MLARGAAAVGARGAAAAGARGAVAAEGAAASSTAASTIGTASRVAQFAGALKGGDDDKKQEQPQYTAAAENAAISRSAEFQTGGTY